MAGFILPYRSGSVTLTSRFGWRTLNGKQDYHKGVDLVGTDKTLVSPCDGVVRSSTIITDKSNPTWEWGNYIRIDRADGVQIFMCHMASRNVVVGQAVKAGDVVGIEGNTGSVYPTPKGENDKTTGRHCHFEVRKNGTSVDPTPYLGIANAAGTYPVKATASLDEDLAVLADCGIINTPGYWKANAHKIQYLDELIHNIAEYLKK